MSYLHLSASMGTPGLADHGSHLDSWRANIMRQRAVELRALDQLSQSVEVEKAAHMKDRDLTMKLLTEASSAQNTLEAENESLKNKHEAMKKQVISSSQQITALKKSLEISSSRLLTLQIANEALAKQNEIMESNSKIYQIEVETWEKSVFALNEKNGALEGEKKTLESSIKTLENRNAVLVTEIGILKGENVTFRSSVVSNIDELRSEATEASRRWRMAIRALSQAEQNEHAQAQELEAMIQRLQNQLIEDDVDSKAPRDRVLEKLRSLPSLALGIIRGDMCRAAQQYIEEGDQQSFFHVGEDESCINGDSISLGPIFAIGEHDRIEKYPSLNDSMARMRLEIDDSLEKWHARASEAKDQRSRAEKLLSELTAAESCSKASLAEIARLQSQISDHDAQLTQSYRMRKHETDAHHRNRQDLESQLAQIKQAREQQDSAHKAEIYNHRALLNQAEQDQRQRDAVNKAEIQDLHVQLKSSQKSHRDCETSYRCRLSELQKSLTEAEGESARISGDLSDQMNALNEHESLNNRISQKLDMLQKAVIDEFYTFVIDPNIMVAVGGHWLFREKSHIVKDSPKLLAFAEGPQRDSNKLSYDLARLRRKLVKRAKDGGKTFESAKDSADSIIGACKALYARFSDPHVQILVSGHLILRDPNDVGPHVSMAEVKINSNLKPAKRSKIDPFDEMEGKTIQEGSQGIFGFTRGQYSGKASQGYHVRGEEQ